MTKTGDEVNMPGWCKWCGISFGGSGDLQLGISTAVCIEGYGMVHKECFAAAYQYHKARQDARKEGQS